MKFLAIGAAALALAGCATVIDGTRQAIRIDTNAKDATCGVTQNGRQVVAPTSAPATHLVPLAKGNLIVTCEAPGYETGRVALITGKNPKTVALALPAILLNAGADSALGGIDWYQERAYVYLKRNR